VDKKGVHLWLLHEAFNQLHNLRCQAHKVYWIKSAYRSED